MLSALDKGGMGVTYRAWDEIAGRPVVIKQPLRRHLGQPGFLERFDREVRALIHLAHPHIVPILDTGMDGDLPFYAMRFLPGGSLRDRRLRDSAGTPRPMRPSTLHLWLWQIAAALDHVHAGGVIHRDVKPANIFFDAGWGAFLGDFGIAKDLSVGVGGELTSTGERPGTERYMAPEQLQSRAVIDGRADQYALAVVAYDILAGRAPFRGETAHVFVEIATHAVPPLQQFCPDASVHLWRAMQRALSKNPADRFSSCMEFASTLLHAVPPQTAEIEVARFLCPNCRTILRMPPTAAGMQGRCSRCRKGMMVAADLSALWLLSETSTLAQLEEPEPSSPTIFGDEKVVPPSVPVTPPPAPVPPPAEPVPVVFAKPHTPSPPPARPRRRGRRQALFLLAIGAALSGLLVGAWLRPASDGVAAAFTRLEIDPYDPLANATVGRHYFLKDDWAKALPHLERSQRSDYRDPAGRELQALSRQPPDPGELVRVAQEWWKLAGMLTAKAEQRAYARHAISIYLEHVGRVTDLGDVEDINRWLDQNERFLEKVGNLRPVPPSPDVVEQAVCKLGFEVKEGRAECTDSTIRMRAAENEEVTIVVAVPRGATSLIGQVGFKPLAGNGPVRVVFQIATPAGAARWQSTIMGEAATPPTDFVQAVTGLEKVEMRVKIPGGAGTALWIKPRFILPGAAP